MWKKFNKYKDKFLLKPPPSKIGEINYSFIDRFTLVHLIIGIVYGLLELNFWMMIFLAIAWELIENPLKANFSFAFPRGTADRLQNAVFDCIAVVLGWALAVYLVNMS